VDMEDDVVLQDFRAQPGNYVETAAAGTMMMGSFASSLRCNLRPKPGIRIFKKMCLVY
jgi:hypothetical protein